MGSLRNLLSLRKGEVVVIDRIGSTERSAKRLADMGFVRGAKLEMLRPGAPCLILVSGVCMGLGLPLQRVIEIGS